MIVQPTEPRKRPTYVARARERFLCDDGIDDTVRESISTSWKRSRSFNVPVDRLELPFVREPNPESPLMARSAPVLQQLAEDLSGEPVGIVLTSADGVVLSRATSSRELRSRLDSVNLAPGYSYSEEFAGTNGIGTALEAKQATLVSGSEHYAGCLAQLSCAGVPIRDRVSGAVVGALDLTGWVNNGGSLLLSLAKSAAAQIEQQMLAQASERESRLLAAYLATCRRAPQMMVLAIAADVVLMNRKLRQTIDPQDQVSMLEHGVDQTLGSAAPRVCTLPSGRAMRLSPVDEHWDPSSEMAVYYVHLLEDRPRPEPRARSSRMLPGIVGNSSSWRSTCERVNDTVRANEWIVVSGEPGSGRSAVLRAAAGVTIRGPVRTFTAGDFDDPTALDALATELDEEDFAIILRDIDKLDEVDQARISDLLPGREHAGWLGITIGSGEVGTHLGATILPFFTHTIDAPPLRHRIEDLHELVPMFLRQLTRDDVVSLARDTMSQLSKYSWPGNVAELRQVLREVVKQQRSGVITADKLPATVHSLSRRTLTRIEALERDAIVASLDENGHNKIEAAKALGISRATIYRKIKEFGIEL